MICLGNGLWIHGKALSTQDLLRRAWEQTLVQEKSVTPWPWNDTWSAARLHAEKYEQNFIVLAGQSWQALAFNPVIPEACTEPRQSDACILAAHRDTHFRP
ncbi:MAG: hypothetical protein D3908_12190 [Candidatus Electrothrix sp. AUS4]|nr:hypothetical protein [Candidatus Electrothrix sp. AUS4]